MAFLIFLRKNSTLLSSLNKEEIIDQLKKITTNTHIFGENSKRNFEGYIQSDTFILQPLFDYTQNDRLRPEISGQIVPFENKQMIQLEFRISSDFRILLWAMFILNLIFLFYLIYTKWNESLGGFEFRVIIPFGLFIFYGMTLFAFYNKTQKSIEILCRKLKANIY